MNLAVALSAAAAWGLADFLAGLAGRRLRGAHGTGPLTVPGAGHVVGFLAALLTALLAGAELPLGGPLGVAAMAGVGNAVGVSLLYHGLSVGRMAVVAPVAAAVTSTVPVVVGLLGGERPSSITSTGVVLAVLAAAAVSRIPDQHRKPTAGSGAADWAYGIGAGLALATMMTVLDRLGTSAVLWPLAVLKGVATTALVLAAIAVRQRIRPPRHVTDEIIAVGILDTAAIGAYLWTLNRDLLVVAAVLVSLYPVGTVLLARTVLNERMSTLQSIGVAGAVLGITLIAIG